MKAQLFVAGAALALASGLVAQPPAGNIFYQQMAPGPVQGQIGAIKMLGVEGMGGPVVTGSPLSATEEHHSLQVLADGTRIERNDTNLFYRDDQGRTRVEQSAQNGGTILIQDPVAGTTFVLDPATKTARKLPLPKLIQAGTGPGIGTAGGKAVAIDAALPPPPPAGDLALFTRSVEAGAQVAPGGAPAVRRMVIMNGPGPMSAAGDFVYRTQTSDAAPAIENLSSQTVNGVAAQGTRTTMTIETGQIGNDRPIRIVSERWYSGDIQMMVKSSNNDPRFGETSYELTNIQRTGPSPALFQIPADYTLQDK
jgi:hypothetical protein